MLSTSCPGRYCTSAPLLPGMLSGLPARRAQVPLEQLSPPPHRMSYPRTDAATHRLCCLECSLGCLNTTCTALEAVPAAIKCLSSRGAAACGALLCFARLQSSTAAQ